MDDWFSMQYKAHTCTPIMINIGGTVLTTLLMKQEQKVLILNLSSPNTSTDSLFIVYVYRKSYKLCSWY